MILEVLDTWKRELRIYSLNKGLFQPCHIYVGSLDSRISEQELEDEF